MNFTEEEIIQCIQNLNSGKAGNEYVLFSEHLKLADEVIIPYNQNLFNQILIDRKGTITI